MLSALNLEFKFAADGPQRAVFGDLPVPEINGSLWSIRFEFFCYIGIAFLGLVGAFRWRGFVVAAFLLCIGLFCMQQFFGIKMPGSRLSYLYCYPERWLCMASYFLAGTLFYLCRHQIRRSTWLAAAAALLSSPARLPT